MEAEGFFCALANCYDWTLEKSVSELPVLEPAQTNRNFISVIDLFKVNLMSITLMFKGGYWLANGLIEIKQWIEENRNTFNY